MKKKLTAVATTFLLAGALIAQTPSGGGNVATQVCQLVSANAPDFKPFEFVPKVTDSIRLNRRPKITLTIAEDGSVSDVKILKGTGSSKVDAGLVRSIKAWKYKPQRGCAIETSMVIILDI